MNSWIQMLVDLPLPVSVVLKVTVVLGVGWILHIFLARRNPRWRVLLWRGVVIGVVIVPILVPWKYLQVSVTPPPELVEIPQRLTAAELPTIEIPASYPMGTVADLAPQSQSISHPSFAISTWAHKNLWPIVLSVWGLTVVLITGHFLTIFTKIRKRVKSSLPAPKHLQHLLDEVVVNLKCSQDVALRYSSDFTSPFLAGLIKPVIILPKQMIHSRCPNELLCIFAHELSHLHSFDLFWMFAARCLSIVLWFHPLVWKLRGAHNAACEEVCDAIAADYIGSAELYSSTLARIALEIVEKIPAVGGVPMACCSEIIGRLRILKRKIYSVPLGRPWVVLSLLVGSVALASLGGLNFVYATNLLKSEPKEISPARLAITEKATTKVLHFSQDQCMGRLFVKDPSIGSSYLELGRDLSLPLGLDPERLALGGDLDFVGLARGDVVVSAGRNIHLITVLRTKREDFAQLAQGSRMFLRNRFSSDPDDLSGLSGLGPNDLSSITVTSLAPMTHVAERVLEPLSRLTGLQMLCLSGTGVTSMEQLRKLRSLKALKLQEGRTTVRGLAVLRDLPALEYLDLDTGPTDVDLKYIGQLPNLRWLRIRTGKIYGPGLAELANLPCLERLCLWGTSPISDRHIKYMEGLTQLKSLTLWGGTCNSLTDASLASIGKLKNLEELYFIRTIPRFTLAGAARLKDLKNLKKVDFGHAWSGREGMYYGDEVVRQLTALPNLESIKGLSYLSSEGMKTLARFRNLKCLHVSLKDHQQGYRGPTGVSHLSGLDSLEELFLTAFGQSLSDLDMTHLECLKYLKYLSVFGSIKGRSVTDRGMASISKLGQLEHLNLMMTGLTKNGLNQLSGLTNLQTLNVTVMADPDAMRTADEVRLDLSALTNLRKLSLSGLSLQDADLVSLAGLHHLESLNLGDTFTEEGLWRLRDLSELKRLSISGISCVAGDRLGDLGGLTKLEDLVLRGRITNAALGRLASLPSIWSLRVETDEPIRPETVTRLKKAMPGITYIPVSYTHLTLPTSDLV